MDEKDGKGFLMNGASNVDLLTFLEDRRRWRQLLAKLHPDAGGDHELFLFACAVREGIYGRGRFGRKLPHHDNGERRAERSAEQFPGGWQDAMNRWALRNREALKNCRA